MKKGVAGTGLATATVAAANAAESDNQDKSAWEHVKNAYGSYDNWGKETFGTSAEWWYEQFHGHPYDECEGGISPRDVGGALWNILAPI